jgi:hypothetical protein
MRTHASIIKDAGGPHAVGRRIAELTGDDLEKLQSRVRGWSLQDSVPGEYWPTFEAEGWATVQELSHAAERKRLPALAAARAQDAA